MPFKFIHAADLHMGCRQYNSDERYEDFFKAFNNVATVAVERRADALLLAGDVFHQRSIEASTLSKASEILKTLKQRGIRVVAIEGNHDRALYIEKQSWMQYLAQAGLLDLLKPAIGEQGCVLSEYDGRSGSVLELGECRIIGLGYLGGSTSARLKQACDQLKRCEKPTVLLLHAAVDRLLNMDMAGVKRDDVSQFADKVDYVALGHVHTQYEVDGLAYNPGAIENVTPGKFETKPRGCYFVEMGKSPEFIPVEPRKIVQICVDGGRGTEQALHELESWRTGHLGAIAMIRIANCSEDIDADAIAENMTESGFLHAEVECQRIGAYAGTSGLLSFEELENHVISEMLEQRLGAGGHISADFMLEFKQSLLAGESAQALFETMEKITCG